MAERDIQRAIMLALGCEPGLILRRNTVGFTEEFDDKTNQKRGITYGLGKGSPDLVGSLSGRWFCLETKSAKGRLRPEQKVWHEQERANGGFVAVVRSVEEAQAALLRARAGGCE
jgi:hypothetical protein